MYSHPMMLLCDMQSKTATKNRLTVSIGMRAKVNRRSGVGTGLFTSREHEPGQSIGGRPEVVSCHIAWVGINAGYSILEIKPNPCDDAFSMACRNAAACVGSTSSIRRNAAGMPTC